MFNLGETVKTYNKLILILVSICLPLTLPDLPAKGGTAKDELAKKGIVYNEDSFVDCVGKGELEAVELFIAEGMEINIKNKYGETALMAAVACPSATQARKCLHSAERGSLSGMSSLSGSAFAGTGRLSCHLISWG